MVRTRQRVATCSIVWFQSVFSPTQVNPIFSICFLVVIEKSAYGRPYILFESIYILLKVAYSMQDNTIYLEPPSSTIE
jgi:hypothetical protein